uniref:Uncharacterized protein n=1 Tax=Salix viminalis TaxID=40686 RepID=A0A6N2MX73_SALVM
MNVFILIWCLTQSSTLERNHNPFPTDSQRYPLFHSEASSSNAPLPTQNQHNHHPSDSTSLSLVQDHVPPESALPLMILDFYQWPRTTGQASYQRKRGRISYAYIDFGDKTFKCCHCMALFWVNERSHNQASVIQDSLFVVLAEKLNFRPPPTPHPLDDLLNSLLGQKSKMFRKCIRAYNSMFAFTSMGVNIDQSVNLSNRMSQFPHSTSDSCLDQTIVSDLIKMLASTNCLVGLFRHASQKLSEPNNPGYKLQLLCQRTNDSREYSNPTSDDIGGLIVGDIGAYRSERDIIIESSRARNSFINYVFFERCNE